MSHEGREGLTGWIRTTWLPYTQRMPEKMREEFIKEIVDAYDSEFGVDQEGFFNFYCNICPQFCLKCMSINGRT
jgi:hypothetical protein